MDTAATFIYNTFSYTYPPLTPFNPLFTYTFLPSLHLAFTFSDLPLSFSTLFLSLSAFSSSSLACLCLFLLTPVPSSPQYKKFPSVNVDLLYSTHANNSSLKMQKSNMYKMPNEYTFSFGLNI